MVNHLVTTVSNLINDGKFEQARILLKKKLNESPQDAWAHYALGSLLVIENSHMLAEKHLKRAIEIDPAYVDAYNHLGVLYSRANADPGLVISTFNKALEIDPAHFDSLINLGHFSLRINRNDIAEEAFGRANQIKPDDATALNNLGAVKVRMNRRSEAISFYKRALELTPDDHICRANYLSCLRVLKRHDELIAAIGEISERADLGIEAFSLFSSMRLYAMWSGSRKMLDMLLRMIDQDTTALQSFSFMEINMVALAMPEIDNHLLFRLHKLAGKTAELGREGEPYTTHPNAMKPAKRWRVGYVSPDFRNHVVSCFLRGLVNERNKNHYEIYCYSNTKYVDNITDEYRAAADVFVDTTALSDRELADRIREDGIHFLVDLTGYTQDGRADVMCYRPAPVQMMYMGYPYTSGLDEVDYFISDSYLDGPENANFFTEKHIHLPEAFTAFGNLHEQKITDAPPCKKNGFITFGSLNSIYKINEQVVAQWSRIMSAVPDSRMVINHPYCEPKVVRENLEREFHKNGVAAHRIQFVWEKHPEGSHLGYYNDVDIALDTFPLTGGTTTIDAIWMGVPVVTLVGQLYHQRLSYSLLKNAGMELDNLIAFDMDEFVAKAVALANDPELIAYYRHAIPEGLKGSVLCDPVRLTRHMELAYVEAWDKKYSSRPVNMEMTEDLIKWHEIEIGHHIATPNDLNAFAPYVLEEQPGWYETEWHFVRRLVGNDTQCVDVGAEYGQYAVPVAARLGETGKLWAVVRLPHEAALLERSLERNKLAQAKIILGGDRKLRLDYEAEKFGLHDVDFVRIHVDFAKTDLFEEGERFFTENSPLVMFGLNKRDAAYNLEMARGFQERGYDLYRLAPGINCLIPFVDESELDVFALNLFACKPDRVDQLKRAGVLVSQVASLSEFPSIHVTAWQEYLSTIPSIKHFIQEWVETNEKPADWEVYWVGLNLFALAKALDSTPEFRYACLQSALGVLSMLAQHQPRLPRLITLARVLADLGRREQVVHLLNQICITYGSFPSLALDEPFVPVSDNFEECMDKADLGKRIFSDILLQREKLRAFSSYFTGQESLPLLEEIMATGRCTPEVERRIMLIKKRYNL